MASIHVVLKLPATTFSRGHMLQLSSSNWGAGGPPAVGNAQRLLFGGGVPGGGGCGVLEDATFFVGGSRARQEAGQEADQPCGPGIAAADWVAWGSPTNHTLRSARPARPAPSAGQGEVQERGGRRQHSAGAAHAPPPPPPPPGSSPAATGACQPAPRPVFGRRRLPGPAQAPCPRSRPPRRGGARPQASQLRRSATGAHGRTTPAATAL